MEQWFFRITEYAQTLLDDLETLDWPESIKARQRNWIGRSDGAELSFRLEELDLDVPVFTTRADTLFGATFFVLAPEHELVEQLAARAEHGDEIRAYVQRAAVKKTEERAAAEVKTGVFTGFHVVNPVNAERLPVYVADYVLTDYGTGAIMAVPGHDERDFAFAQAYELPVREVVRSADGEAVELPYVSKSEDDVLVNSNGFDGLSVPEGGRRIVEKLEAEGRGRFAVNYRLRDWGWSRQRYWGCPIPVVYCETDGIVPVPESELPVVLPHVEDFKPKGKPPLAQAEDWINVPCPKCGKPAKREAETMDTFVDSAWYFLRYCDPHNDRAPFEREPVDYWNPVDLYIGGVDHATMHMIYARYFVKVLNDMGMLGFREPFAAFYSNGWVTVGDKKISKRAGNAVGPDDYVDQYGADPVRLYILFIGPADQDMEWTPEGVDAMARFVRRLWRVVNDVAENAPHGRRPGRRADAQGARDDRQGDGRRRPAVRVQHRDLSGDGARERAAPRAARSGGSLRGRDGGVAAPALRPACDGGVVAAPGSRAAVGGAVADRRRLAAGARRRSSSWCRSTARFGIASRWRPTRRRRSWSRPRATPSGCRASSTARRCGRRSSCRRSSSTSCSGRPGGTDTHSARSRHTRVTVRSPRLATCRSSRSRARTRSHVRRCSSSCWSLAGRFLLGAGAAASSDDAGVCARRRADPSCACASRGRARRRARCVLPGCTAWRGASESPTRSSARAERRPGPTLR